MTEGRLRGKGLRSPQPAVEAEHTPIARGSLTTHLEFGNFGAGIGELEVDGFEARISNNSKRQDALAVSTDKKVFVVCDGLGGTAGSIPETVSAWSRAVAEVTAQIGSIQTFVEEKNFVAFISRIKRAMEARGTNFALPEKIRGRGLGVMTTLSAVERLGKNVFHILAIGDSPIYVIDKATGKILKQYGEDAIRGETSAPIENAVGMDQVGSVRTLRPETQNFLINESIVVHPGQLIVIGSDFFSDHTFFGRNLKEYIGLSPEQFHAATTLPDTVKVDDASLIVIDPEKLPSFEK